MAPRSTPERLASLETKMDMFLQAQQERDKLHEKSLDGLNAKMDSATKYIAEDSGKNKAQARMWGFSAGIISGFLVNLFTGHPTS